MANCGALMGKVKGGHHGYHPDDPEMHTGFIAAGAQIRKAGIVKSLKVVDTAAIISRLLNVSFETPNGKMPANLIWN